MALTCSTCGATVAETAIECPACGTPTGVLAPEKRFRWQPIAIGVGVLALAAILLVVFRPGRDVKVEKPAPVASKAPEPEKAKAPEAPKAPVAEAPKSVAPPVAAPQEQQAAPAASKNSVRFLIAYSRDVITELRPVVSEDETPMQQLVDKGAGGLTFRPLGLACGPEREPYFAWAASRDGGTVQVGASCGNPTLAGAAQRAIKSCRDNGGCDKAVGEVRVYAADVRDAAGDLGQAKPKLSCQLNAGKVVTAYGPDKVDFTADCDALF